MVLFFRYSGWSLLANVAVTEKTEEGRIKELVKVMIPCSTPCVKLGVEILDEEVDRKYEVLPFEKKHFHLPFTVITVAKKKQ